MDYKSVSSMVLLAVIVIVILGWLPRRTFRSMSNVAEHRRDRFSPSLHLIEADRARKFSDGRVTELKGACMDQVSDKSTALSRERISEIRRMRKAAAVRRRIVVFVLFVAIGAVLAAAFTFDFSPFYALIPTVLMMTVLALGVRATRHARAWEQRLAHATTGTSTADTVEHGSVEHGSVEHGSVGHGSVGLSRDQHSTPSSVVAADGEQEPKDSSVQSSASRSARTSQAQTQQMERRQIRRALRDANKQSKARSQVRASAHPSKSAQQPESTSNADQGHVDQSSSGHTSQAQPAASQDVHSDSTTQLSQVTAAHTLDLFDLAAAQPELISFSLDGSRAFGGEQAQEPHSLEIKSTRQVATAVPVQAAKSAHKPAHESPDDGSFETEADESNAVINDVDAFHNDEEQADVDVPAATDDSLGTSIASILARRVAR